MFCNMFKLKIDQTFSNLEWYSHRSNFLLFLAMADIQMVEIILKLKIDPHLAVICRIMAVIFVICATWLPSNIPDIMFTLKIHLSSVPFSLQVSKIIY